eukprot:m.106562 g.106562  ORF g.106562 m.106562 type:complete len:548 (+) comp12708_c1_seq1:287-1930(+)
MQQLARVALSVIRRRFRLCQSRRLCRAVGQRDTQHSVAPRVLTSEQPSNIPASIAPLTVQIQDWDVVAVMAWLSRVLGVSSATRMRLLSAGVDGSALLRLNDDKLLSIGVADESQRRKVLAGIDTATRNTDDHAILSPSSSKRWLSCPPSARFEEHFAHLDIHGSYAQQGVFAHELAAVHLKHQFGQIDADTHASEIARLSGSDWFTDELKNHVDTFVLWAVDQAHDFPTRLVELRANMDRWVPGGWGTADLVLASDSAIHVIDFKYGKSRVATANNTQLQLYALGVVQSGARHWNHGNTLLKTSIYQPRSSGSTSVTHTQSVQELLDWAEHAVRPQAQLAFNGIGDFFPGPHCQFCIVRGLCRSRAMTVSILWSGTRDFVVPEQANLLPAHSLSDEEVLRIMQIAPTAKKWLSDVEQTAHQLGSSTSRTSERNLRPRAALSDIEVLNIRRVAPFLREWLAEIADYVHEFRLTERPRSRRSRHTKRKRLSDRIMVFPTPAIRPKFHQSRPASDGLPGKATACDKCLSDRIMVLTPNSNALSRAGEKS